MPGTYRYSATFDRTYEESEANPVRFSIQSWQGANRGDGEEENGSSPSHVRSPSTDSLASGSSGGSGGHSRQVSGDGQEMAVPGRTSGKLVPSPIHNPLQFVKVGPVQLGKKAEEQIKLLKQVKQQKTEVNHDEEWQMNLDKWKSRRKKVSEKTIQRIEERRQIETAMESQATSQRKIKTFSEMLEERSQKPRSYNLAIYKDDGEEATSEENKTNGHSTKSMDDDSELQHVPSAKMTNGDHDDDDTGVGDSGLESFGSSQRTYDIQDSSSEISGGSLDRLGSTEDDASNEGITTGVDLLEEFSSPSSFSSRDLNEEPPSASSVDLKSLERFFKNSTETEKAGVESLNGDDSSARDCHSKTEKPKKTPPPVPTKPKLLRALSAKVDGSASTASSTLPVSDSKVISKKVETISRTDKPFLLDQLISLETKATQSSDVTVENSSMLIASPNDKYVVEQLSAQAPQSSSNRVTVDSESLLIQFDDSDIGEAASSYEQPQVTAHRSVAALEQLIVGDSAENKTVSCSNQDIICDKLQRHDDLIILTENESSSDEQYSNITVDNNNSKSQMCLKENKISSENSRTSARPNVSTQYVEITPDILNKDDSDSTVVEEQIIKVDAKAEAESSPSHMATLSPILREDGLTIIYQSHPPSSPREGQRTLDEKTHQSSLDKVVLNNIIDELETAIKCEMESEEASASQPAKKLQQPEKKVEDLYNLTLELYTDEQLLANLDAPPSQVEPPKERPPPPPPAADLSSSPEKSSNAQQASNGVQRMSTFKRIKKELWRRRSDFLGIDPSEESVDVDAVPPPPDLQEMLKSEREIERQWMEQNRPVMVPEDEIVRREREIIENLEREERERKEGEKDEQELMLDQGAETGYAKQEDEERIRRLKDERRRMEEERFQREEQRMRLEEERILREREEQMRKQEECVAGDLSETILPGLQDSSEQEVLRLERERLQQEREAFLREKEEYTRRMDEQKKVEAQKMATNPGRDALVCASKHPQGFNASNNVTEKFSEIRRERVEIVLQEKTKVQVEQPTAQPPVIMRNRLQSLGAAPKAKYIKNEQWIHEQHDKITKRRSDPTLSRYNQNHWLIQEAEMRRLAEQSERQRIQSDYAHSVNASDVAAPKAVPVPPPKPAHVPPGYPVEQQWNYRTTAPIPWRDPRKSDMVPATGVRHSKPSEPQDHFLSVSGKEKCSHCGQHLGRGEAMIIESLQLCYHLQCFRCCVCQAPLGNGSCGTDVRVRNNKLHCQNCYSNDEAGLKFSQV